MEEKDNGLNYGFGFDYDRKRHKIIGESFQLDILDLVMLAAAYPDSGNDQNLFVRCDECNEYMTFIEGTKGDLSGHWKCPKCGVRVLEKTPYHQLERENERYLKDNELDGYGNNDEDYDEYYGYLG